MSHGPVVLRGVFEVHPRSFATEGKVCSVGGVTSWGASGGRWYTGDLFNVQGGWSGAEGVEGSDTTIGRGRFGRTSRWKDVLALDETATAVVWGRDAAWGSRSGCRNWPVASWIAHPQESLHSSSGQPSNGQRVPAGLEAWGKVR